MNHIEGHDIMNEPLPSMKANDLTFTDRHSRSSTPATCWSLKYFDRDRTGFLAGPIRTCRRTGTSPVALDHFHMETLRIPIPERKTALPSFGFGIDR
jgi:hypothetical protein